jgi:hypothetical protein
MDKILINMSSAIPQPVSIAIANIVQSFISTVVSLQKVKLIDHILTQMESQSCPIYIG